MKVNYNYLGGRQEADSQKNRTIEGSRPQSTAMRTSWWLTCCFLAMSLLLGQFAFAQTVTIGSGANVGNKLPVVPYFGYSYSQQIVLKSEIATSGNITKLSFYSNGTAIGSTSNTWTIYMGHTTKSTFGSNTDWILSSAMTQVFSGTVPAFPEAGWFTITLTTPFAYNNVDNLVVSVDENGEGFNGSANYARIWTTPVANRAIYYQNDSVNPDPATINLTGTRTAYMSQMQLEFATATTAPSCATAHAPANLATNVVRNPILTWANGGGAMTYDVYFGNSSNPALIGNQTGTSYTPSLLNANTTYYWKIIPKNVIGAATGCIERSFTTGTSMTYCTPSSSSNSTYINNFSTSLGTTNISNATGYTTGGYQNNFNTQAVTSFAGGSFNYTFTIVGGSLGAAIWIDWNNNGIFETDERVFNTTSYSNGPFTGSIVIPAGTTNSDYRLRAMVDWNEESPSNPCMTSNSRTETEDYKITVGNPPSCAMPTSLASSMITSSSATFNWAASISNPSNGYDVYYSTTNVAPTAGTTPSIDNNTSTTAVANGLSSSSTYYWWVRSDCGDTSAWASGGSFTTTQVVATIPFMQDFSGTNSFTFVNGTQVNKWVIGSATGNPGNSMYISNDGGVTNTYTTGTSSVTHAYRDIAVPSGASAATFAFDWKANGESSYDYLRVWLVPISYTPTAGSQVFADAGRIQVGANYFNQQATWQTYTNGALDLSSFANSTMRLVFEWRNDSSGGSQNPVAIDNISLSIPSCVVPTSAASSAVTANSAMLSWTASSSSPTNGYDIYYSTTNTAPEASTTPTVDNYAASPYAVTGLTSSTTYYWWLRSDCGSEMSIWTSAGSFTTQCAAEATPTAVQTFDTFTGSAPSPTCWSEASGALTANSTLTGTTSSWTQKTNGFANVSISNKGASINLYGTTNSWLISQPIDLGPIAGENTLNFDYAVTSYSGTTAQSTLGSHSVRVVVSTDGGNTWSSANIVKTYTGAGSYSNTGATEQILLNYSGIVKIGFLASTTSTTPDIDFHIDNFSISSACTPTTWYADADGDGFGDAAMTLEACDQPDGYVANATDCDDTEALVWRTGIFFVDNDGDEYTAGLVTICYGTGVPAGYSETTLGDDCDDNDAATYRSGTFYVDADGDGYTIGESMAMCYGATIPEGYAVQSLGTDCDDNNAEIYQSSMLFVDNDGDGYTVGEATSVCHGTAIPEGYVIASLGVDCDDNNPGLYHSILVFADSDGDGYTVGVATAICFGTEIPAGYTETSLGEDCNDNDATVWQSMLLFVDMDGDGYTVGETTSVCYGVTMPEGYVATSLGADCNDNDANVWRSATVYVDLDGDGFHGSMIEDYCYGASLPLHYSLSTLGMDCNDNNAAINPDATEIPNNGIDENCNGMQDDEVVTGVTVTVKTSQCGATLPRIYSSVFANVGIQNVTMFTFEVTDSNNMVQVISTPNYYFQLTSLASYEYNTMYSIRVGLHINGVWQGFGAACSVSTPDTKIVIPQCGTTLANAYSPIFLTGPNFISSYEIKVTNDLGTQTITRTQPFFSMKMLTSIYDSSAERLNMVEVRFKTTGAYGPWTPMCEITTPAFPNVQAGLKDMAANDVKIVAYPNPFSETFALDITRGTEGAVEVRVYDMIGKLLEVHSVQASELSSLALGNRFPAGVYNVIATHGGNVQTLRVIKR